MRLRSNILTVCIAVIVLCMSISVYARGGVYIDDLVCTNNGSTVFSDNFNSGDLSVWDSISNSSVTNTRYNSADYSLYQNCHGMSDRTPTIIRNVSISNYGPLELSFKVWLPPASEQWNNAGSSWITVLYVTFHSDSTDKSYSAGFWLYPHESKYRLYLNGQYQQYSSNTGSAWQNVMIRLDPNYVSGCGGITGQGEISCMGNLYSSFSLSDFPTIDRISVWSTFGNSVPEPSSIVAIVTGLMMSGIKLRKIK